MEGKNKASEKQASELTWLSWHLQLEAEGQLYKPCKSTLIITEKNVSNIFHCCYESIFRHNLLSKICSYDHYSSGLINFIH